MTFILYPFLFGLFEATFFFIVPDVLLSYLALFSLKGALIGAMSCIIGSLIGGLYMYRKSQRHFFKVKNFLVQVPAISDVLLQEAWANYEKMGIYSILLGTTKGIPYKIFAVFAPKFKTPLFTFLLVSIPARGIRFFLSVFVTYGLAKSVFSFASFLAQCTILTCFWILMYILYFRAMAYKSSKVPR